jgi:hypothetical protein
MPRSTITWANVRHKGNAWNPYIGHGYTYCKLSGTDLDLIENMSVFQSLNSEIAHALGLSERVLQDIKKRDPEVVRRIAIGRSKGQRLLRAAQFKAALAGNTTLLIWFG